METGATVWYRGFSIVRPCKEDFITRIAHDTLQDAKEFLDRLIALGLIVEVSDDNRK